MAAFILVSTFFLVILSPANGFQQTALKPSNSFLSKNSATLDAQYCRSIYDGNDAVGGKNRGFSSLISASSISQKRKFMFQSFIASTSSASTAVAQSVPKEADMGKFKAKIVKFMMLTFISSMCIALPVTLFPIYVLRKLNILTKTQSEHLSLITGQFCARWLLRLIPFTKLDILSHKEDSPEPSVWVCNHVSMLDIFIILAADKKMRGKNRRPMKSIYWRGIESNPICKLLFRMSGFIPVDMADNGNGNTNSYNKSTFKSMLKLIKEAFQDGFDVSILPEGQLNPTPEKGLLDVYPGAFTLAKMSRRPIRMCALNGTHKLWHADENIGMTVTGRDVKVRVYPPLGRHFADADDFKETFTAVVGQFGTTGNDLPVDELNERLGLCEAS